jgi:hypothetical protein
VVLFYDHERGDEIASAMPIGDMRSMIRECIEGVDRQNRPLECLEMPIRLGDAFDLVPAGYEMPSLSGGDEIPVYVVVMEPKGGTAVIGCALRNPTTQKKL